MTFTVCLKPAAVSSCHWCVFMCEDEEEKIFSVEVLSHPLMSRWSKVIFYVIQDV